MHICIKTISYNNITVTTVCHGVLLVRQAWETGEIWRNLGELNASYVAVKLYQSMPILMFVVYLAMSVIFGC